MGKNSNKKLRAAKKKAAQGKGHEPHDFLTPNDMIEDAMKKDFAGLLKAKCHRNGLLDVSLVKGDSRIPITNLNAQQSPLLRLPAELRNRIARMVIGDQHIHISMCDLPTKSTDHVELPVISIGYTFGLFAVPTIHQHSYPLDWRTYYGSQRIRENMQTNSLGAMFPEKRVVYGSNARLTNNFALTCRQIYQEIGLLVYSTNEFSFCSPYALNAWLDARLPIQRRAIQVLWLDIEWKDFTSVTAHLNLLHHPVALKLSRLTWTAVEDAYWEGKKGKVDNVPIADFDKGMDIMRGFLNWLSPAQNARVEYVNEREEVVTQALVDGCKPDTKGNPNNVQDLNEADGSGDLESMKE